MMTSRLLRIVAAAAVLASSHAVAEWEVRDRSGGLPPAASVRGDDSAVLRILSAPQSEVVFGTLTLPTGLTPLSAEGCPTFKVDRREPGSFAEGGSCTVKGRSVSFVLGTVANNRVQSRALREMMGGRSMVVTYRYDGLGYASSTFALAGSLQALTAALDGWRVAPR